MGTIRSPVEVCADSARMVVLVDGDCALCHGFTQFVAARDRRDRVRFATQQSPQGRILLESNHQPVDLSTIVCVELEKEKGNAVCYTKSTAVLRTMRHLDGLWPLLSLFLIIPQCIRDAAYNLVASNRYRIFGKTKACRIPDIKTRKKVLDLSRFGSGDAEEEPRNPSKRPRMRASPTKNALPNLAISSCNEDVTTRLVTVQSEEEFEKIIRRPELTIGYFSASWCGPCKFMGPKIQKWADQKVFGASTLFLKVDVDKGGPIAKRYKVKAMPHCLLFKNSKLLARHAGTDTFALEKKLLKHV